MPSKNSITKIKHLSEGVAIFQTGRSKFWMVRIWNPSTRKYSVKSTKETSRIEAIEAVKELLAVYQPPIKEELKPTLGYYARQLSKVNASESTKTTAKDEDKIIFRKDYGVADYWDKVAVTEVKTTNIRDYLLKLDEVNGSPLSGSTKSKYVIVIRKTLKLARESGAITNIPDMPKVKNDEQPRPSFTEAEYLHLLKVTREAIKRGDVVRDRILTMDVYNAIVFTVASFVRPVQTELFGLRHIDITEKDNPARLEMSIKGKTGSRVSVTMPVAVPIYKKQQRLFPEYKPTDYVFLPDMKNRSAAVDWFGRAFAYLLETADLKLDKDGNNRSSYSLRHFCLQRRLARSGGQTNIYALAKNAGTSVLMLERHYLKKMEPTKEIIQNIQFIQK